MYTIKITPNLLFEYQYKLQIYHITESNKKNRFGSENRIQTFLPELECSTLQSLATPLPRSPHGKGHFWVVILAYAPTCSQSIFSTLFAVWQR